MSNELEGKVAVVTGGASGLGEGLSRRFAAEGAKVLIGDIDRDAGAALAEDIGSDAYFVEADVAEVDQISGLVSTAVQRFGGLHVMVNNAGVSGTMHRSLFDDDLADFEKIMAVNLRAVMAGTRDAALHMRDAGGGSIINITSTMGRLSGRAFAAYGTAKGALAHYTRLSALDLCPRIRVNAIAPGSILTSALDIVASNDALRDPMEKATPMRRLGDPSDIAAAAVYLASPAGSYLTGKTLEVDGGLTFPNLDLPIPDL